MQISTTGVNSCEGSALAESRRRVETRALFWLVAVPHYVGSSPDRMFDNIQRCSAHTVWICSNSIAYVPVKFQAFACNHFIWTLGNCQVELTSTILCNLVQMKLVHAAIVMQDEGSVHRGYKTNYFRFWHFVYHWKCLDQSYEMVLSVLWPVNPFSSNKQSITDLNRHTHERCVLKRTLRAQKYLFARIKSVCSETARQMLKSDAHKGTWG